MIENKLKATELIDKALAREGYESFAVVGRKGAGKTTYAVKVATQLYQMRGYGEDSAYKLALKVLLFDKNEIIAFLKHNAGRQQAILIWDDARAHGSAMGYLTQPRETQILLGLMDTARDSVASVILTSPSTKGLLGFLKNEEGWLIKVTKSRIANWRDGTSYQRYELPSGQMRIAKKYIDQFHRMLPSDIYQAIKEKRRHYKDIIIKNLEDRIKTSNEIMAKKYAREKALLEQDGNLETEEEEGSEEEHD